MKIKKDEDSKQWTLNFDKNGDIFAHTINDWAQLFGKWNWITFHFVHVYFENDIICPGFVAEVVIFGLGFRFRANRSWEDTIIEKSMKEVDELIKRDVDATYQFNKNTITKMHEDLIETYGGIQGVRDEALLSSAIHQPILTSQYESLTPRDMAAAYCYHLCQNHAFVDGNKRIACAAMLVYLRCYALRPLVSEEEILKTMLGVANGNIDRQQLSQWLPSDDLQSSTTELWTHIDYHEAMKHFKDIKKQYHWLFAELAK